MCWSFFKDTILIVIYHKTGRLNEKVQSKVMFNIYLHIYIYIYIYVVYPVYDNSFWNYTNKYEIETIT